VACFYVVKGVDKGMTIDAPADEMTLGRGDGCVSLRDMTVSRRHARIRKANKHCLVEDFGSANGTYVNGVRIVKPLELKQGDQIRIGKTVFLYSEDKPLDLLPDETDVSMLVNVDQHGSMVDSAIMAALPADEQGILVAPDSTAASAHLRVIYKLINAISSIVNVEQLLNSVMNIIFEEVYVDRGFILMLNESTDRLEPKVVRYRDQGQPTKISTSKTIVQHVMSRKEGVLCTNAMADARFEKGDSIHSYELQSVLCVPIIARDKLLGIIHIDTAVPTHSYTQEQLRLMTAIGNQTGLAVHNAQLYQDSVRAERLAATGETVASLSHYIKNILQGLIGGSDMVQLGLDQENLKTVDGGWQIVNRNLEKIHNLMLNMLAFSKEREPRLTPIQLNKNVAEVLELIQRQADDRGVMVVTDFDESMPAISADPDGVHQVVLNVLTNALDAVPKSTGVITLRTHYDHHTNEAQIIIGDNGPGIPRDQVDKIFDMFHSTKGQGGTGLGLAVAKKIVSEHGGRIDLRSQAAEGTVVTVRLSADLSADSPEGTEGHSPDDTA